MEDIVMLKLFLLISMVVTVHSDVKVESKILGKASWGSWGVKASCHESYVNGFSLKVEPIVGDNDETALNGIHFACADGDILVSADGPWGSWSDWQFCPDGEYFDALDYRSQGKQGAGDDTAGNNLNLHCSGGSWLNGNGLEFGDWDRYSCGGGSKLCGLQTELEPKQGTGDDAAICRIQVECCYN